MNASFHHESQSEPLHLPEPGIDEPDSSGALAEAKCCYENDVHYLQDSWPKSLS